MKKDIYISWLLFFTTFLYSCGDYLTNSIITLDINANRKKIVMHPSQILKIDLFEDTTQGIGWRIQPYAQNIIGFISSKFVPDYKIAGAGGHRIIIFKALNYGVTKLKITPRDRNKTNEFHKDFEITIVVVKNKGKK